MKVQTEVVVTEVKRYVADDGKVFETEAHCKAYEKDLARADLKAKFDLIECCKGAEDLPPADGGEYPEYNDFHWYRPKTREEADVLCDFYEIEYGIGDDEIGQWICIEECDGYSVYCYSLNSSIIHAKKLFGLLGYDVRIMKKEDNHV